MSLLYDLIKEDYGIKGNGRWFHAEEHNSLVYDAEKDVFFWNSQDIKGDVVTYLTKVRGLSFSEAKRYSENVIGSSPVQEQKEGEVIYEKLAETFHANVWEVDRSYFYNRLITDQTIKRFRLGYYNGFYTIPFFEGGKLRQIQLRRDSPKLIKNYYKDVGPLLFNKDILQIADTIYITEGLIGCILLAQNGIPSVSMNIGAEGFQPEWAGLFRQSKIFLLFDNDSAGLKGALRTSKILGVNRCRIYKWDVDSKGYAVDDFLIDGNTAEDLIERVKRDSLYPFQFAKG